MVDSITEAVGCAEGCFVVSGSHGGLSSGRFALQGAAALVAFNDAGVGKDGAGIAALALLEEAGRAACTVSHASACIGVAASSLADGVISHVNTQGYALGLRPGQRLAAALDRIAPAPA